jgi:hypothetical protein
MQTFAAETVATGNQGSGRNSRQAQSEAAGLVASRVPKPASDIEIFHWIFTDSSGYLRLQILLFRHKSGSDFSHVYVFLTHNIRDCLQTNPALLTE